MNDRLTFKNREKWVNYAQHLREINYALNNLSWNDDASELLLNSVNFQDEFLDIEKKSNPLNEIWANIDMSSINMNGYYKAIEGNRSFEHDRKTIYYHILGHSEKRPEFLECEEIQLSKGGAWAQLQGDEHFFAQEFYKRTFAIRLIDKHIVECTEAEWNKAKELYNTIKSTFNDSRR